MAKLTLSEIGRRAHVSSATVSRVINGYPHIRPEIRERVQKIIDETGYQPNQMARALASNNTNIVGLFVPNVVEFIFADPYLSALIPGVSRACNVHESTLALFLYHTKEEGQRQLRRILSSNIAEGLIITADCSDTEFMPLLFENDVPFVLMGRPSKFSDQVSFVDYDNVGGAYSAVNHLLQLGRRRIAIITNELNTAAEDRTAGYLRALEEWGIEPDPNLWAEGDFTERGGYIPMQQLLPQHPDAVFSASDTMAIGALRAIHDAGLSVPDDIAVTSFDDLPSAATATPPLTTVHQSPQQQGALAVDTLLEIVKHGADPVRHIILPTKLVVRASCGAVLT